jgi:hypothetical protein
VEPVEVFPGFSIYPRSAWANQEPTGPLEVEQPTDVLFLLVHHTASANNYDKDSVVRYLRGVFDFHTGPEKKWPDIAYNFVVDRFGRVWEARQGSLTGPIKGSATGGSQGFALLCSFIGDHNMAEPTPEAVNAMGTLLGWLAHTHDVDITKGAEVEFASRGSNRWPAGSLVLARTISAHREMSQTTCPGDFGYAAIDSSIAPKARQVVTELAPPPTTDPPETTTTTEAPTTTTTTQPPTTPTTVAEVAIEPQDVAGESLSQTWLAIPAAAVAAVAGLIAIRRRRI